MTEDNGIRQTLGEHKEAIAGLKEDMAEVKADVKAVLAKLNEGRGAGRVIAAAATLLGGGIAGAIANYLGIGKP